MSEKQLRDKEVFIEVRGQLKKSHKNTKTNKVVYLEKHSVLPGHEGGNYDDNNILLLTFAEHTMAHYLRYLQYGKVEDLKAYRIMMNSFDEDARRQAASLAGLF